MCVWDGINKQAEEVGVGFAYAQNKIRQQQEEEAGLQESPVRPCPLTWPPDRAPTGLSVGWPLAVERLGAWRRGPG